MQTSALSQNKQYDKADLDSYLFNVAHFWDVKLKHILNTILQGNCGARTPCAGTHQFQFNCTVFKPFKDDITSIFLHCGPCKQHK